MDLIIKENQRKYLFDCLNHELAFEKSFFFAVLHTYAHLCSYISLTIMWANN